MPVKYFKESINNKKNTDIFAPHQISKKEALSILRIGNVEFCKDKKDKDIIESLLHGFIYTNFSRVWAVKSE